MAFTSTQLDLIRGYLGYPSVYLYQDPRLEGVMATVGNDPDASARVISYLTNITAVLADIQATALPLAGFKSGDRGDAELFDNHAQIRGKQKIGRMWVGFVAKTLGVPVNGDLFDGDYGGNAWAKGQRSSLGGLG